MIHSTGDLLSAEGAESGSGLLTGTRMIVFISSLPIRCFGCVVQGLMFIE